MPHWKTTAPELLAAARAHWPPATVSALFASLGGGPRAEWARAYGSDFARAWRECPDEWLYAYVLALAIGLDETDHGLLEPALSRWSCGIPPAATIRAELDGLALLRAAGLIDAS